MKTWLAIPALLIVTPVLGQDLTGEEIIRHTDQDHRATDERGEVQMVLQSKDGTRQQRTLELLLKSGEGDDDLNLVRFLSPANIRGTAVLTVEASGRADDQWLYLPRLKKTKRIASSGRSQRFAGTDFTFEDLRSEDFTKFAYRRLDQEATVDGTACHVVEATPKEGAESGYSKRNIYVDKERFLIHKVEFYDKRNRHQKTLNVRKFKQHNGLWRAEQSMMDDHLRQTKTVWRVTERQINPGLPDSTFTVRSLERGS